MDGEAAFAASNTNILIKGNNTWLVSVEKIESFYSPDKGASWTVFDTNCSRKSDDVFYSRFL
jgi:hypothetical protein